MKRVLLITGCIVFCGVGVLTALYWARNPARAPREGPGLLPPAVPVVAQQGAVEARQGIVEDISVIDAYTFDPAKGETGKIRYRLTEPARVRVIVTGRWDVEQVLRVILWKWQDAGPHTVLWDGRDQAGHLLQPLGCSIWVRADPKSAFQPDTFRPKHLTTAELVAGHQGTHTHNTHAVDVCRALTVRFKGVSVVRPGPQARRRDGAGVRLASATLVQPDAHSHGDATHSHGYRLAAAEPRDLPGGDTRIIEPADGAVVSGVVVVLVDLPEGSRGYGDETGYGSRWTINDKLLGQALFEPDSNGMLWYEVDTTAFPNGIHRLNVSVCDHYDHVGSASIELVFDN